MKLPVLSGMSAAGVFSKKDRILCYQLREPATIGWLKRQRFKAEGPLPDASNPSHTSLTFPLYDVVIVEQPGGADASTGDPFQVSREAMRYVRPGGLLLVSHEGDGLFDAVSPTEAQSHLAACFYGENAATPTLVWNSGPGSDLVFGIKKGGAYKPRLPVKYIDGLAEFQSACERLASEKYIGLDVETTLTEPRILCTVQMASESQLYVIDMLPIKDMRPLKVLMENSGVMKIIHNRDFEAAVLGQYGIEIHNVYDTLIESRKRHKKKVQGGHRLGEVCERELGLFLDKSYQASDWTARPLSQEQLDYAAVDAEVMIRLYRVFAPPPPPETMNLF